MLSNSHRLAAALSLTFLAGGAAGWLAGYRAPPDVLVVKKQTLDAGVPSTPSQHREETREPERGDGASTAAVLSSDAGVADSILAAVHVRDYFRRRHDIYALGQQLDRDTIRAAMEATRQFSETDRDFAEYPLLARWLELDPAAAYAWVGALPKQSERASLTREFFHSLGLKDPAMALTFLAQYKASPNHGEDLTYSVFEAWSVHDPTAAVDAALRLQKKDRGSALSVALGRWAKRDPQGALARVAQLTDPEQHRDQLRNVLHEWAEEDPQAAANHALNLPPGKERNDALASVVAGAASADRDVAMRLIGQIPAGAARNNTLTRLVQELGYSEPKVAAEFVLALPPTQQRDSVHQVVSRLARQDRAAALDWAGRLTSAEARTSAMQSIVQEWSSDDPKAAAQYCVSNAVGTPEVLRRAVANWARDDAPEALAWAGALPDGPQREAALASGIAALGGSDPQQAASLATTMLSGEKQSQALGSIAGAWAVKDPVAAARWTGQLGDSSIRANAVSNVANVWARQDPAAAAAWAISSPENGSALSTISREWAAQDPTTAAKWLDTLPSGNTRDSAVASFSQVVTDADPEGAAAWAATISQPAQRDNAIDQVFQQWKRTDPKTAEARLRATPALSAEARARMLRSGN